jgi:hypothetical protein
MFALIAQLAIRIIFDNRNAEIIRQPNQFMAAAFRHCGSPGILKIRQHVHEFWTGPQRLFQKISAQAVVIAGNTDVLGTVHIESLQSTQIGWCFHQDAVTRIDKQLADQVQCLLRAGGNQNVLGLGFDAVPRCMAGDHFAQRLVALGRPILQRRAGVLLQYATTGFPKPLDREHVRRRQAAGKGDHLRTLRELQQLADG